MQTNIPFSRQQRITNTLLLNASFIDNLGLMHGKMGIVIYFFHLASETKSQMYEDYAEELIDEIYEEISIHTLCDFENGLAGIGWGIEYLVKKGFIDADTNVVLEEIDKQINHEITYHAPFDIGVLNGISGYILYFISRLSYNEAGTVQFESIRKTLIDLLDMLKQRINTQNITVNGDVLWNEPEQFDLTWDYPAVIWVLVELIEVGLCVAESELIISQLISPMLKEINLPKLQSHRLLIALALEKIKQVKPEIIPMFNAEKILVGIERDVIAKELADKSAFLRNGTMGIAIVFNILYKLTNNPSLKEETEYWKKMGLEIPESDQGYAGFFVDRGHEKMIFGVLNGLLGLSLFSR